MSRSKKFEGQARSIEFQDDQPFYDFALEVNIRYELCLPVREYRDLSRSEWALLFCRELQELFDSGYVLAAWRCAIVASSAQIPVPMWAATHIDRSFGKFTKHGDTGYLTGPSINPSGGNMSSSHEQFREGYSLARRFSALLIADYEKFKGQERFDEAQKILAYQRYTKGIKESSLSNVWRDMRKAKHTGIITRCEFLEMLRFAYYTYQAQILTPEP